MIGRFVFAVLLIFTASASAKDAKGVWTERGSGADSCGKWTQQHSATGSSVVQDGWLMGYMTAFNFWALKDRPDVGDNVDSQGLVAAMSQYCAANPLDDIGQAANMLTIQLLSRFKPLK